MMIQLFDVQDKKLVPSTATMMIPELKAIITNFPDEYLKVLWYIFCMTCPDGTNPYINVEEELKEQMIIADLKPTFYLDDLSIAQAIDKCNQLYETPTRRAWQGCKRGLEKISRFLSENEITGGKDGTGTLFNSYMSKIGDFNKQFKDIEKELNEEQAKVRGDSYVRYDMKPGYKNTKEE